MATRDYAKTKDGIKIRYEIRGHGDPLALIMGFSANGRMWGETFLKGIEKRFQTVVIDNRGTGESDKPDQPLTLVDIADDVAAVLDHAKIPRAHIYGISMGGMVAQEFALHHPGRIRGLVLGCTTCGMKHGTPPNPDEVAKLMPHPGLSPEEQARLAFSAACGRAFLNSSHGQEIISQAIKDQALYPITPERTYVRQMEAVQGFDTFDKLGQIKAPTMVIHGDGDTLVPHPNAELLQQRIPGSKLHIMPGIGHMFTWEAPEESVRVPGDFLASVG